MHFDHGNGEHLERVQHRHRSVGIGGGIENDGGGLVTRRLDHFHQLAFLVALGEQDGKAVRLGPRPAGFFDLRQGGLAVNLRLPAAQQIEVGPVEDMDRQGLGFVCLFCHSLSGGAGLSCLIIVSLLERKPLKARPWP